MKPSRKLLKAESQQWPKEPVEVPRRMWPSTPQKMISLWRSRRFLIQVFSEDDGIIRLSICRTEILPSGNWQDNIRWDDLQTIKGQIGFGGKDAVEVFPCDKDVVNVANMRHLWILPEPIRFAWRQGQHYRILP